MPPRDESDLVPRFSQSPLIRPAGGAEPVLVAVGLTKTCAMGEVQVAALRGIDLTLGAGELVVLLGASGSDKSTLLNILGGLDVPSSGQSVYRGRDLTIADERTLTAYRRHHVGFVFQFYNLVPSLTARENVELGTTTAVITHNSAIAALADRVVQLTDGRLGFDRRNASRASPAEIQW